MIAHTRLRSVEVTVALGVAAAVVWATVVVVVFQRQPVLGGDFMQFYTIGTLARSGDWTTQYAWPALHQLQADLVPGGGSYNYAPAYPPLMSALYAPFTLLGFPYAFTAWALATAALYVGLIRLTAAACTFLGIWTVVLGSLVYPPFIALIVTGQSTLWPLAGFVGGWYALAHGRPVLAGATFALVAIKPHFGLALGLVLVASRSWRIVAGVVAGLAALSAATFAICGAAAIEQYFSTTLAVLSNPGVLDPIDARYTHSLLSALVAHLPRPAAETVWAVSVVAVIWLATGVWRNAGPLVMRMSAMLFATLIVSPHVLFYDAVLIAPAVLWLLDRAVSRRKALPAVVLAALMLSLALPAARVFGFPLSLPLMVWLLWLCRTPARP